MIFTRMWRCATLKLFHRLAKSRTPYPTRLASRAEDGSGRDVTAPARRGRLGYGLRLSHSIISLSAFLLAFAPTKLQAAEFTFKGQTVEYENAEYKEIVDAATGETLPILIFRENGWFKPSKTATGRALVVGGGGAGGYGTTGGTNPGGGGGGGEVKDQPDLSYLAEITHTVTIGAGAAQTTAAGNGANGEPSTIAAGELALVTALGGGGGGAKGDGNGTNIVGMVVATGGGGGGQIKSGVFGQGGLGTISNGGKSVANNRAGGGGGAGGAGVDAIATKSGDGGAGFSLNVEIWFPETLGIPAALGGGGGGAQSSNVSVDYMGSGKDGGGDGGRQNNAPGDGTANTGGGGGGGGRCTAAHASKAFNGGAGGSGIVVIRFEDIEATINWVAIPVKIDGQTTDGKIFVDDKASATWLPGGDLVIAYSNTTLKGGLRFFNPDQPELPPVWAKARILAVGGGGGGGMIDKRPGGGPGGGAGGGAGGFVERSGLIFDNRVEYQISVGAGGAGGKTSEEAGKNGRDSTVKTNGADVIEAAIGGGGGGAWSAGGSGGSGGGGSYKPATSTSSGVEGSGGSGVADQGFAGGTGNATYRGAGGGGAGGRGGDANNGMYGGAGTNSFITGSEVWYAGGGGGAYVNSDASGTTAGGAGGKGGGGTGAGEAAAKAGADGLGGGGGGGASHRDATEVGETAGDGGSGIVIIRLSGFVVRHVPRPVTTDYTYDGNSHVGVEEFYAYELSGDIVASNADVYAVTARIDEDAPYTWWDGGRGDRILHWTIHQLRVPAPAVARELVYNGAEQCPVDREQCGLDEDGVCHAKTNNLPYCRLTPTYLATDVAEYHFTAKLIADLTSVPNVTNFVWSNDLTMKDRDYTWRITQAPNEIRDFLYPCRKLDRLLDPRDSFTSDWPKRGDMVIGDNVVVEVRPEGGGEDEWKAWGKPTEKGSYEIRITIPERTNWKGAGPVQMPFGTWEKLSDIFSDRMEVTVAGNTSGNTELKDFPVPVKVHEPARDGYSAFSGFSYARAGATGRELRFFDASGDPVEHEVDTWNIHGESVFWVRVPSLKSTNTKLTMCWRRVGDIRIPIYDPAGVWRKNYAGVWHFSQEEDGIYGDSTGNDRTAYLTAGAKTKAIDGKLGKALYIQNGDLLADDWPYPQGTGTNKFTFSGWYHYPDFAADGKVTGGYKMFAGTKLGASTTAEMKTLPGWCLRMNNANNRVFWGASGTEWERNGIGWNLQTTWGFLGYVGGINANGTGIKQLYAYNNTYNKQSQTGATYFANASGKPLQLATGGFEVDEVRLSTNVFTDVWTEQEYRTLYNAAYCTYGLVRIDCDRYNDGNGLICDYWTAEPSLAKTVWREGETWPTESKGSYVATSGGGAGAAITPTYRLIPDGEPTTEHPTAKGHYRATYDHSAPAAYRPQPYTLDFYIIEATVPIYDIGGNGGDSGRILLMNADNRTMAMQGETYPCGVTNQGWCAQSDTGVTYWRRPEDAGAFGETNNVKPWTSSELVRSADTNVLWRLYDCRQGNTFPTNDNQALTAAPWNSYCYLPASSSTALSITNEDVQATRSGTGWILMRNVECPEEFVDPFAPPTGACVYSPCYSNGIGTIYFDALNGRQAVTSGATKNSDGYRLVLEIATENEKGEPPFDENSYSTDGTHTNWYGRLEKKWRKVDMSAYWYRNTAGTDSKDLDPTNCLALAETSGGYMNRFYRIHARIDVHKPCRFRIRRVSIDETATDAEKNVNPDDGYILLDNIIASFPPIVAELKPYGRFDPTLTGLRAVGYGGAFETPFPSAAEGASLTGRCAVAFSGDYKPDEESFSLKQMFYRWRYLEQLKEPTDGDWKAMDLQEADDELRTAMPLETPAAPGDIEFYFVTILRTPYYGYVDYSGMNLPVDKARTYTEEGLPHESRFASPDGGRLASGGKDWYVRLRDGRSRYEGLRLLTRPAGGGAVETNAFELVGDDQWTVKIRTLNPVAGGLDFRIEGLNPQESGSREYAFSTDCWRSDGPIGTFPSRATIGACGADEWGWFACDAATGWLYFQLDLPRLALQVAHAEAEDFSKWASAVNPSGLFVGSAVDTNSSSAVTTECEVNWSEWSASVATNGSWQEDFGVSPGTVTIASYPRNVPFSTARTLHGWTAESAMWTYGKWSLQNNADATKSTGDDSAVQLRGGGLGRLSFIDAANVPDGLDTVTYRARVAQVNGFEDFSWYDWVTDFEPVVSPADYKDKMTRFMKNYTFATIAALTETGRDSYDGDGSISLVGYYQPGVGCYEFRVSRGTNEKDLRLALFRWRKNGAGYVCDKLLDGTAATSKNYFDFNADGKNPERGADRLVKTSKTIFGGLYLSVMEKTAGKTLISAGVCEEDVSTMTGTESMNNRKFTCITYQDSSANRLSQGAFGVSSCNCPAVFAKPICYRAGVDDVTPGADNKLVQKTAQTVRFTGDKINDLGSVDSFYLGWILPGRLAKMTDHSDCWGFQTAPVEPQKVLVQVSDHGKSIWEDVYTNTVSGFTSQTFPNRIHDARQCDVRLQVGDSVSDARTDIVVDDVSLTQWNGQWTPNWDETRAPWYGLTNKFVYTSAWVNEKSGRKSLLLQPARARTSSTPVSLRTPLMRGLGLIHFAWRNADPRAKIRVQYKENVTELSIVGATENLNEGTGTDDWTTFETIEVGALGASGSYTSYLNRRYNGKDSRGRDAYFGLIRLVIDRDVEAEAMSRRRADPNYGAVEITDAFAWDYPEFDKTGWNGWNFRAAGWDGTDPDEFANLKDSFRGLAGLLNNTLDENTLAEREKGHYAERLPSVQSPAFRTNAVGALTFRARLYDAEDLGKTGHGAVVTVYGCNDFDKETGEPVGDWTEICDVEVSNATYAVQSVKIPATLNCKSIRLAVKGVKGVTAGGTPKYDPPLRVAIDDIVVWERLSQTIAFRKAYVRPFRDATAIKGTEVVKDISEVTEQPLIGESFGFQAEIEVLDPDEVITDDPAYPITVDLWYYAGSDVWGYENWKTNPAVVKVVGLTPATDGNGLIFRSTVEQSASLCPPQFLEEGEGYRIVQYHMVAHYFVQGHSEGEHHLTSSEWSMPEWNTGFTDPNETAAAFSAFTLLEEIAPGRAWINEINFCEPKKEDSLKNQWIELAVPSGVDMTDWTLDVYDYEGSKIATLARLGRKLMPASKTYRGSDPVALASHYAFYTLKAPSSTVAADADWLYGSLEYNRPYAFELRRPTGVVEHRVVAQGWNQAKDDDYWYAFRYEGTNTVRVMTEKYGGEWTWSEEDYHSAESAGCSVSVVTNQGMQHTDWVSPLKATPGDINVDVARGIRQYIDPNWYILPNGGYVKIYSTVVGEHMRQIIGGVTNMAGDMTVAQGTSTSIVYEVDRWYKLGSCEVNPSERTKLEETGTGPDGKSYYTLNLNLISNRIDITASADISDNVAELIDPKYEAYTPAIMRWLEKGVTGWADGGAHPFKNPNGPLVPGYYRGHKFEEPLPDDEKYILGLVELYWLDLDPTAGGWEMWGGMGARPGSAGELPVDKIQLRSRTLADGSVFVHTNHLTSAWLELRNKGLNEPTGLSYPPYRLQGLENEQSDGFVNSWTSETFKVTMCLNNGKVDWQFQPVRHFVFGPGSFHPVDDPETPYAALIEITDPFSDQSPAAEWGWKKYESESMHENGLFTRWRISGSITPDGVSTLKKVDLLEF